MLYLLIDPGYCKNQKEIEKLQLIKIEKSSDAMFLENFCLQNSEILCCVLPSIKLFGKALCNSLKYYS